MVEYNPIEKGAHIFSISIFQFGDGQGIGVNVRMHHNVVDATRLSGVVKLWTQRRKQWIFFVP
ncbi:hypothetical protein N7467_003836 [Penicillium canescens]|nr:hypothetical protein N7467_003836 [Penicillium canescens]